MRINLAPRGHFHQVTELLVGSETYPPLRVSQGFRTPRAPHHPPTVAVGLRPGAKCTTVFSSERQNIPIYKTRYRTILP